MSGPGEQRDSGAPRRPATVLDLLRARIDLDRFDAVAFTLETVVADLGYGDVRPLPGSIAWIDRLRDAGKRTALVALADSAALALELAGVDDRLDVVTTGPRFLDALLGALAGLDVEPGRAIVVASDPAEVEAAIGLGTALAIGVVRGSVAPERLRKAGVAAVVADLEELLLVT